MSTRLFSRARGVSDRALFWNGLCVALIALAIVTVFIDALPTKLSIGLCVLGVVAGLVGIPLYIAQVLAGWRSARGPAVAPPEPEPVTVAVEAPGGPADSDVESDSSRADGADGHRARCSCHGLPCGSVPHE
ncbi:hypothetical protein [Tsukamurella sp. NPDC003166]|uniref:hypothetical protein n=1 Tax=Tsukamurella sp. NPDC003166 TaxID=3154444 RepID=UPI0033BC4154